MGAHQWVPWPTTGSDRPGTDVVPIFLGYFYGISRMNMVEQC